MCGRVIQASGPLRLAIVDGLDVPDSRLTNVPRRYNAAPSQELLVIRQNHQTGERSLDFLKWGLIPCWCADPRGGRKPINAEAETVARLPLFRDAYARRRCILPVDGFFEWKAIKGQQAEQPFAIAMKDGSPSGIAGLGENYRKRLAGAATKSAAHRPGSRPAPSAGAMIAKFGMAARPSHSATPSAAVAPSPSPARADRVGGMGLGHAFASASRFRKVASLASDTSTHFG